MNTTKINANQVEKIFKNFEVYFNRNRVLIQRPENNEEIDFFYQDRNGMAHFISKRSQFGYSEGLLHAGHLLLDLVIRKTPTVEDIALRIS